MTDGRKVLTFYFFKLKALILLSFPFCFPLSVRAAGWERVGYGPDQRALSPSYRLNAGWEAHFPLLESALRLTTAASASSLWPKVDPVLSSAFFVAVGDKMEASARFLNCFCYSDPRPANFLQFRLPLKPPQVLAWDSPPTAPLGLSPLFPPTSTLPPLSMASSLCLSICSHPHKQTETSSSHPSEDPPKTLHMCRPDSDKGSSSTVHYMMKYKIIRDLSIIRFPQSIIQEVEHTGSRRRTWSNYFTLYSLQDTFSNL